MAINMHNRYFHRTVRTQDLRSWENITHSIKKEDTILRRIVELITGGRWTRVEYPSGSLMTEEMINSIRHDTAQVSILNATEHDRELEHAKTLLLPNRKGDLFVNNWGREENARMKVRAPDGTPWGDAGVTATNERGDRIDYIIRAGECFLRLDTTWMRVTDEDTARAIVKIVAEGTMLAKYCEVRTDERSEFRRLDHVNSGYTTTERPREKLLIYGSREHTELRKVDVDFKTMNSKITSDGPNTKATKQTQTEGIVRTLTRASHTMTVDGVPISYSGRKYLAQILTEKEDNLKNENKEAVRAANMEKRDRLKKYLQEDTDEVNARETADKLLDPKVLEVLATNLNEDKIQTALKSGIYRERGRGNAWAMVTDKDGNVENWAFTNLPIPKSHDTPIKMNETARHVEVRTTAINEHVTKTSVSTRVIGTTDIKRKWRSVETELTSVTIVSETKTESAEDKRVKDKSGRTVRLLVESEGAKVID